MTASPITVGYSDTGVVLQTASGAIAVLPPDAALAIAEQLVRAIGDFNNHQALIRAVDDAATEED